MNDTESVHGVARNPDLPATACIRSLRSRLARLALCCALTGALAACNGDDAGSGGSSGQSMSGQGGVSGAMSGSGGSAGSGGTTAGDGATGGEPLRPPNPRPDIGSPDSVTCLDWEKTDATCTTGQKCCPANLASDGATECVAPEAECMSTCHTGTTSCAEIECDGPEDCPGQLCCLRSSSCSRAGQPCTGGFTSVSCEDRCEPTELSPGQVVCKDPRDCLVETAECLLRNEFPHAQTCR